MSLKDLLKKLFGLNNPPQISAPVEKGAADAFKALGFLDGWEHPKNTLKTFLDERRIGGTDWKPHVIEDFMDEVLKNCETELRKESFSDAKENPTFYVNRRKIFEEELKKWTISKDRIESPVMHRQQGSKKISCKFGYRKNSIDKYTSTALLVDQSRVDHEVNRTCIVYDINSSLQRNLLKVNAKKCIEQPVEGDLTPFDVNTIIKIGQYDMARVMNPTKQKPNVPIDYGFDYIIENTSRDYYDPKKIIHTINSHIHGTSEFPTHRQEYITQDVSENITVPDETKKSDFGERSIED